ncbi:MAG: hypothetical protein IPM16_15515 [Chloroflexi bacterium]|nr:hypothetical protein [Chloroflexota bacterium]
MRRLIAAIALTLMLPACAPQGKTGAVTLVSPPNGTVIYSSVVTVAGDAQGVNSGGLIVTVAVADGVVLTQQAVDARDGGFEIELVHPYAGPPTEATVSITAADAPDDPPYATASVTLASIEHRPEGTYIDVAVPQPGDEVGGDEIGVQGRASGLSERTFSVVLVGDDGAEIDRAEVTLPPSYLADELPWQAALTPGGATGSVLVQIITAQGDVLHTIPVILSGAAG